MAAAKKPAPKAAAAKEKKPAYKVSNCYEVKDGKLVRKNKFSPKKGDGFFMAEHKDRRTCGSTGFMEKKTA